MSTPIVKNTIYLITALIGQKFIAFVYFTILARSLTIEEIGLYSTAVSLSLIFSIFVDIGLTSVLIRDLAALHARSGDHKTEEQELIGNTFALKFFLSLIAYAILYLGVRIAGYPEAVVRLSWIAGVIMILDSTQLTLYGILRALGNLRYEAYGMIIGQLCAFGIGVALLARHASLAWFLAALAAASVFNVVWSLSVLRTRFRVPFVLRLSGTHVRALLFCAAPFALAGIFVKLYSFVDSLLLARIAGVHAVGLYSIPYKLAFAFQFIPLAVVAALYPAMSRAHAESRAKLKHLFEQSMIYVGMIAVLIVSLLLVIAEPIIRALYGAQYLPGVGVLRVLAVTLFFTFLGYPAGSLLNASRRQNVQTMFIGLTAALNISLNFLLIPFMGIMGAALAALISNIFLTVGGCAYSPKLVGAPTSRFVMSIIKICMSGIGAIGGMWFLIKPFLALTRLPAGQIVYVVGLVVATSALYVICLYAIGVLRLEVLKEIIAIFKRDRGTVESIEEL
ncbi:MAG: oligosaccharide flippase family protein [Candidatus Magasanikbacteria bacterium]|nr:oligosaccharide flippase family protein [Candidatus Magasanikbacteria bacterium]